MAPCLTGQWHLPDHKGDKQKNNLIVWKIKNKSPTVEKRNPKKPCKSAAIILRSTECGVRGLLAIVSRDKEEAIEAEKVLKVESF